MWFFSSLWSSHHLFLLGPYKSLPPRLLRPHPDSVLLIYIQSEDAKHKAGHAPCPGPLQAGANPDIIITASKALRDPTPGRLSSLVLLLSVLATQASSDTRLLLPQGLCTHYSLYLENPSSEIHGHSSLGEAFPDHLVETPPTCPDSLVCLSLFSSETFLFSTIRHVYLSILHLSSLR